VWVRIFRQVGLLAVILAATVVCGAGAGEVGDLDVNMPNTLEDAFVGERGSLDLFGAARYDRWRRSDETVRFVPQLQWVPAERLQLSFGLPYTVGSGSRANQGEVSLGGFYQLNRETGWLPAFAAFAEADAPIGPGDRSWEIQLGGIASKTIDPGPAQRRLHFNAIWFRRLDPGQEERRNRYRFTLGYSQLVAERTALVTNVLRESQERGERDATILEAGLRHQIARGVILGGALGTGIGRDSPRFRAIISIQFSLSGG
jgi:hypothetical protein